MALIAPALLAADFARLGEALETIEAAGCRMVHVDVGDGHFSRDVTLGQPVLESIRKATKLELDVHLLIERPERYVAEFAKAGADRLAVHPESTPHLWRTLRLIREAGAKAGIALQPGSPLTAVSELFGEIDFINVLTADPEFELGFASGWSDDRDTVAAAIVKLRQARSLREQQGLRFELQVEGAIGTGHVANLAEAGTDILVSGFAIFHGGDPATRLRELIALAATPSPPNRQSSKGG